MDKSPPLCGQKSAARRSPLGSPPRKSAQADKVRQEVRVVAESAIKSPRRTESPQADLSSGHADFFGGSFRQSASEPLGLRRKWRKSAGLPADSAADWRSPTRRNFGRTPSGSARSPAESERVRSGPRRTKVRHGYCPLRHRIV